MEILQPGKVYPHDPMKDPASPKTINNLLPQVLIQGDKVLCRQITTVERSKTLVHMLIPLTGNGEEGGVIPQQEGDPDSATKRGKKGDSSRKRDTEEVTGVKDRGWRHLVK